MIDHVGVLVTDLQEAKRLYAEVLGWTLERELSMEELGLDAAFFRPPDGGSMVELVELTVEGRRAPVIANTTPGLDHIAIRVDDIEATLEALAALGVETTGLREVAGRQTAFTRPETGGGVVYQLLEAPR
jgi:methylmalonyl-CoA epimerase